MSIESLLSRPVVILPSSATCAEAARRMRRENIASVVIEQDGAPIGIVTERDLVLHVMADDLEAGSLTVARVMSAFPAFLTHRGDVRAALDAMLETGVRRLPAVNAKGRMIGVLSLDDILIELSDELGKIKNPLQVERGQLNVADELVD
jgi:signal-transduction protein with cAMP-binding, CBS, and nucleotidyltransferase domain